MSTTEGSPRVGYVREAVLDAAAAYLLRNRDASMAQIADAAGVGRATLYRRYDSRDALLRDLADHALSQVIAVVEAARLESADVREAMARLFRGLISVGHRFEFVLQEFRDDPEASLRERIGPQVEALLRRGQEDGSLRRDVPILWLGLMFRGHAKAAIEIARDVGPEEAAAFATRQFLDGAQPGSPVQA